MTTHPREAVAVTTPGAHLMTRSVFSNTQLDTLKRVLCREATDTELALLGEVVRATGASPFRGDVAMVVYNKNNPEKRRPQFIFSTEYAQKRANHAGILASMKGPFYRARGGQWSDVWDDDATDHPTHAKVVVRRIVRNTDGSVASIEEEDHITSWKSAWRDTDFWKTDGVHMLGIAARRRALKKLDVLDEIDRGLQQAGVRAELALEGDVIEGQSRVLDADEPAVPAYTNTLEGLQQLMSAASLQIAALEPVLTRAGEPPINARNFEPRLKRWLAGHPDMGVMEIVEQAVAAGAAAQDKGNSRIIDPETGEVTESDPTPYPWEAELRQEMEAAGLPLAALERVVGAPLTFAAIDEWLAAAGGRTPHTLVRAAADAMAASTEGKRR